MTEEDILIVTKKGMVIKVPSNDIKAIGRLTCGVKGIGLKDDDEVVSAFPATDELVIITTQGKGKRIKSSQFIIQSRGGRGVSGIKLDIGDHVAAAAAVSPSDSLLIVGKPNSICIPASELSEQTRNSSGTKVIEKSTIQTAVRL